MPDDLRAVTMRDPGRGDQRRIIQVDEREAMLAHQPLELAEVRRQRGDLAPEHEPAQALVGAVPRVGEDRDVAGVDGRARRCEQLRRRALRAEDVRLEALVQVRDQLRERGRSAAELRPVVDVEDRNPVALREDAPVNRLDPARVLRGVEVPLRVLARGAAEAHPRLVVAQEARDRVGERLRAEVLDEEAGLAGNDYAAAGARARGDDRHAARRSLDHRASELRALGRRDDHVGGLVQIGRVLREGDEADVVGEPELGDEVVRLRFVVPGQVGELQRAPHDGLEELLAADGAADDQVARVESLVAQTSRGFDELPEALRRVDEAEVRHDRTSLRQSERALRGLVVAGVEAIEVDRVRDDGRADAEDSRDVVVDRDRGRGEVADRGPDELRAPVAPAVGQGRAQVPDDRQALVPRQHRRRNQRRVVEVDELEAVAPERAAEAVHVLREQPQLTQEEQPAPAAVRRSPDVREARYRAGVDLGARLPEELGRGPRRAVDVRLELLVVQLADEIREGRRRTAQLAAVVDE